MKKVWNTIFGSFLPCYHFVPNEIWQHNSCSNYSNWLQRVQDDHVISCFMGEGSPPSPYFHASVVFKGILYRTVNQSTSIWILNTVHQDDLWIWKQNQTAIKKKMHCLFSELGRVVMLVLLKSQHMMREIVIGREIIHLQMSLLLRNCR